MLKHNEKKSRIYYQKTKNILRFLSKHTQDRVNIKRNFFLKKNLDFLNFITIKTSQNNIFCSLMKIKKGFINTICTTSSGIEKIKTSTRNLKYTSKNVFYNFFSKIKNRVALKISFIVVKVTVPQRYKKFFIKPILNRYKKSYLLLNIKSKKAFNGCKSAQKRRKKRRGGERFFN